MNMRKTFFLLASAGAAMTLCASSADVRESFVDLSREARPETLGEVKEVAGK